MAIASATLTLALVAAPADAVAPSYVALGDSYAAGPLIPVQEQPWGCLTSTNNYAHLLAPSVGLPLRDASCSGATTADMTAPQDVSPDPNPAQFDRLDGNTRVVTLQIGGNDIGFSSIAENCFTPTPLGHPCQDRYVVGGVDEITVRIAATAPKVAAVIQGIHDRSPKADVYVLGYSAIFPEAPLVAGAPEGCYPTLPIAYDDVPYLRAKEKELNSMIAAQAGANGATYVDVYTPSIGKDACEPPVLRWIEPAVPVNAAAPVHPNLTGMEGVAAVLRAAIVTRTAGVAHGGRRGATAALP